MIFCIDGRYVTRKLGGQERYATEIVRELDTIVPPNLVEIIVPQYAEVNSEFKNIKMVHYGKHKGNLWEQIDFWKYLRKGKRIGIYLCASWPIFRPDIVTIHDVSMMAMPEIYNNLYGKLSVKMHTLFWKAAKKRARAIFTISQFSKNEIIKYLRIPAEKIMVVDCGWQHMERIRPDYQIFEEHPELVDKKYYLSVSSRTPQKNFKWIVNAARHNPNCKFAIVGEKVGLTVDESDETLDNLIYLGRISDGKMKALMEKCYALIHPAIYEGFGMTPLEAASTGAAIIISTEACLPEIYGDSAHYIDPNNAEIDLDILMQEPVKSAEEVLNRYSWKNNAENLLQVINTINKRK